MIAWLPWACILIVAAGFARIYWLNVRLRILTSIVIQRSERLEMVVGSVRAYREHGTASAWRGVIIQLDRLEASEPRRCPNSAVH